MIQKLRKKLGCKKGFTLIELIVVIAILGILAAIAIPQITGIQENAREQADLANARQLANTAAVLFAQGDIAAGDHNAAGAAGTAWNTAVRGIWPIAQATPVTGRALNVNITAAGVITVTVSTAAAPAAPIAMYPAPGGIYND